MASGLRAVLLYAIEAGAETQAWSQNKRAGERDAAMEQTATPKSQEPDPNTRENAGWEAPPALLCFKWFGIFVLFCEGIFWGRFSRSCTAAAHVPVGVALNTLAHWDYQQAVVDQLDRRDCPHTQWKHEVTDF